MTIENLKAAHDAIPPTTPMNRAKRAEIMKKIRDLQKKEEAGK